MSGILSGLLGGEKEGSSAVMTDILQQILTQSGGVSGLISRFQQAGFGDHVQSWMNGDHLPISGNHIGQVFTDDEIAGWASQAGTDPDKMRAVLAEAMPHAVDHATPNGEVPAQNAAPDLSGLIGRFFGGAAAMFLVAALSIPGFAFADETVAGKWLAHLGSNVSVTMNVTPDGKWDSATARNGGKVAQMSGTYQQQTMSPTHGMLVFTPTQSQVTSQHGAAEVENDLYEMTDSGQVMHLTSGGDTMTFHKQQ